MGNCMSAKLNAAEPAARQSRPLLLPEAAKVRHAYERAAFGFDGGGWTEVNLNEEVPYDLQTDGIARWVKEQVPDAIGFTHHPSFGPHEHRYVSAFKGEMGQKSDPGSSWALYLYKFVDKEEGVLIDGCESSDAEGDEVIHLFKPLFRNEETKLNANTPRSLLAVESDLAAAARVLEEGQDSGIVAKLRGGTTQLKSTFQNFKVSGAGVFFFERWLPFQDLAMDLLVTFGKEGWPLCSADGLYWSDDIWWTRISIALIGGTYLVLMVVSFPILVKVIQRQLENSFPNANVGLLWTTTVATWLVIGLPTLVISDVALMITYPCSTPPYSWLANIARLRVVTETLLESPGQSLLQGRMLYVKVVTSRSKLSLTKVSTLAYSLASSLFAMGFTVKGIYDMSVVQEITFVECLWDLLSVGLDMKAPLLQVLKTKHEVDYSNEGPLSDEHLAQICQVLPTCSNLKQIRFGPGNHLSSVGWSQLARALPQLIQVSPEIAGYIHTEDQGCVQCGGQEIKVEYAGASKAAWALSLGPSFGRQRLALTHLVPEPQTPKPEPQTPQEEEAKQTRRVQCIDLEDVNDVAALQHISSLIDQFQLEFDELRLSKVALSKEVFLALSPLLAREAAIDASDLSITPMVFTSSDDEVAAQAIVHARPQLQVAASGAPSMLFQVADGSTVDLLHSENIKVSKPTAADLRWLLSAPAAKVLELLDPELSVSAFKSCVAAAKELCRQRPDYKLRVHFQGDAKAQDLTSDDATFEFTAMSRSRSRLITAAEARSVKLVGLKNADIGLLANKCTSLAFVGSIALENCRKVTTSGFRALASLCPNVTSLSVTGCHNLTDEAVKALASSCQSLTAVYVADCKNLTDESARALATYCPNLTFVGLKQCHKFTDEAVKALASRCPNLTSANFAGCKNLTDEAVKALASSCPNLTSANFADCEKLTDEAVKVLTSSGPKLTSANFASCTNLTDEAVKALASTSPKLISVTFADCESLTDEAVKALASSGSHLTSVNFARCKNPTDEAVKALASSCPNLTSANFADCEKITDEAVITLASSCPNLTSVTFADCENLTDEAVKALASSGPHLTSVNFASCKNLTDEAVKALASSCPNLTYVNTSGCPKLTPEAVMFLASSCKKLASAAAAANAAASAAGVASAEECRRADGQRKQVAAAAGRAAAEAGKQAGMSRAEATNAAAIAAGRAAAEEFQRAGTSKEQVAIAAWNSAETVSRRHGMSGEEAVVAATEAVISAVERLELLQKINFFGQAAAAGTDGEAVWKAAREAGKRAGMSQTEAAIAAAAAAGIAVAEQFRRLETYGLGSFHEQCQKIAGITAAERGERAGMSTTDVLSASATAAGRFAAEQFERAGTNEEHVAAASWNAAEEASKHARMSKEEVAAVAAAAAGVAAAEEVRRADTSEEEVAAVAGRAAAETGNDAGMTDDEAAYARSDERLQARRKLPVRLLLWLEELNNTDEHVASAEGVRRAGSSQEEAAAAAGRAAAEASKKAGMSKEEAASAAGRAAAEEFRRAGKSKEDVAAAAGRAAGEEGKKHGMSKEETARAAAAAGRAAAEE